LGETQNNDNVKNMVIEKFNKCFIKGEC